MAGRDIRIPAGDALAIMRGAIGLAITVAMGGCGPSEEVLAEADRQEAAHVTVQRFAEKYEVDARAALLDLRPGAGSLGGLPAECGYAVETPGGFAGSRPRAILAGKSAVVEGAIGLQPAVFDELWRRAGC